MARPPIWSQLNMKRGQLLRGRRDFFFSPLVSSFWKLRRSVTVRVCQQLLGCPLSWSWCSEAVSRGTGDRGQRTEDESGRGRQEPSSPPPPSSSFFFFACLLSLFFSSSFSAAEQRGSWEVAGLKDSWFASSLGAATQKHFLAPCRRMRMREV